MIDTDVLGELMISFANSVRLLSKETNESPLDINVKAINPGSFELVIGIFAAFPETLQFLSVVNEYIKNLFDLYNFLKGEPPGEVNKLSNKIVEIKTNNGEVKTFNECVFNVYTNSTHSPLGNVSKLVTDPNVESLEILNTQKELMLNISKEEFPYFIPHSKVIEKEEEKEERVETELSLHRLVFGDPVSKWGFIYDGHKINAKIQDESFLRKITLGIPFRQGDRLRVILQKTKKFDHIINAYVIKKYEIIEVLDFYQREEMRQGELGI